MKYKRNTLELLRVSDVIHSVPMNSPTVVFDLMRKEALADREIFWILHLNAKNRIVKKEMAAMGSVDHCWVMPSIALRGAVLSGASSIITVHNHPSGDPAPSEEDKKLWRTMGEACRLLGIRLLDNIILGAEKYYSAGENNLL